MILAIDTSTRYGGVALWRDDRPVATHCWYSQRNHTAELMPAIQSLMISTPLSPPLARGDVLADAGSGENGTKGAVSGELEGLKAVAVALGPGGFSAVRVGISAAKGLALPLNIPVVGVGTLEIEAYPYADTGLPIRPVMDAGREEVATGLFQNVRGTWTRLEEERICTPEEMVEAVSKQTIICGEGAAHRAEYLRQAMGAAGIVIGSFTVATRLWALGVLARQELEQGAINPADSLSGLIPMYLRSPSIGATKKPQRVGQ